jgi:hypothetical protein
MTTPELDDLSKMALKSWRNLNAVIVTLNEDQVSKMIAHEMVHGKRETFLARLHKRFTALRSARERMELFQLK